MEDITTKIVATFEEFKVDAEKAKAGNKAAGRRARMTSLALDKLLLEFRKESVSWK